MTGAGGHGGQGPSDGHFEEGPCGGGARGAESYPRTLRGAEPPRGHGSCTFPRVRAAACSPAGKAPAVHASSAIVHDII